MLARHGWRKLAPDKSHPQADPAAREAWKKTLRAASRGSGGFCGPTPATPNVSGRSTFRPHQRCAALLGQEAPSPHGTCAMLTQQYTYAYGAVSPLDGRFDSLILPWVNGDCMQLFVNEIAARYPHENIVMVMGGAGWHKSQAMKLAENMRILFLPPYSPELNPQEHVWDELRESSFITVPSIEHTQKFSGQICAAK